MLGCDRDILKGSDLFKHVLLLAAAAMTLWGCGSPTKLGGPGLEVTTNSALPFPDDIDQAMGDRPYRLGPTDKIMVDVFGQEELSQASVQVDAGGQVSLPMAGQLMVSGKTPAEVAEMVAERLRNNHVRNPQVAVNLVEANSQVITVDGAVKMPGLYPVVGRMTLMRAVATAKGTTEFAKLQEVVVFRTVGGQRMAGLYSLKAVRDGRYPDPEVFAGDVVVVGDSPARRLFRDIVSMGGLLTSPLVAVVR
jgi:polysaccharide export outer membrane protein